MDKKFTLKNSPAIIAAEKAIADSARIIESQGQVLDSLKDSPIQKECDALK